MLICGRKNVLFIVRLLLFCLNNVLQPEVFKGYDTTQLVKITTTWKNYDQ